MSSEKKGVGEEIIQGLRELNESISRGEPLRKKFTVRTVELNLEELSPREYDEQTLRQTREALGVSQAVFAKMLAVSKECLEHWEQGRRTIPPMACRLLDLINTHREDWVQLLSESVKEDLAIA